MKLWSIQHKNAYDRMLKTGSLRADEKYLIFDGDFKSSYLWMAQQMTQKIGPAPNGIIYPVWAWYRWEGARCQLDMRTHGWHATKVGESIVLLTLEVPDKQVLLSDFDYWHHVLNNWEIRLTEEDWDREYTQKEIEETWQYIFDITCSFDPDWAVKNIISTQACMWEIKQEWVEKAEFFVSRGKRNQEEAV